MFMIVIFFALFFRPILAVFRSFEVILQLFPVFLLGTTLIYLTDSMDVSLRELRELVVDREAWRAAIQGVAKSRTWLSDWTEL